MAKPAPKKRTSLNLLYPQGIPQKLPLKFLRWILTFGRYIAVVVEILVLITFAARFKFDQDLANINEEINKQVPFIESLKSQENLIRKAQFKIENINKTIEKSPSFANIIDKIANQTPTGVSLTNINFDTTSSPTTIKLSGKSSSNNDLAIFLYGLNNEPTLKDVNLVNINFAEGVIEFVINATKKES